MHISNIATPTKVNATLPLKTTDEVISRTSAAPIEIKPIHHFKSKSVKTERATIEDIPALIKMLETYNDHYKSNPSDISFITTLNPKNVFSKDSPFFSKTINESNPITGVWKIICQDKIIGFSIFRFDKSNIHGNQVVLENDSVILPEYQNNGIAKHLQKQLLIQCAASIGATLLYQDQILTISALQSDINISNIGSIITSLRSGFQPDTILYSKEDKAYFLISFFPKTPKDFNLTKDSKYLEAKEYILALENRKTRNTAIAQLQALYKN